MALTNIELQTLEAVKSASRAIVKQVDNQQKLDNVWEQRRYEIARDFFTQCLVGTICKGINADANKTAMDAVACADALIEELKKAK